MNHPHAWRFTTLGALLSILPAIIVFRLVTIQTNPSWRVAFGKTLEYHTNEYRYFYPARGAIYDRWGHVLAANKKVYEIAAEVQQVKNPHTIARTLNKVIGLDYNETYGQLAEAIETNRIHVVLWDNVEPEKIAELESYAEQMEKLYGAGGDKEIPSLSGLVYTPHLRRSYPEKELASNILGFAMNNGHGAYGIEGKYDEMLAGTPKVVPVPLDPNQAWDIPEVPDGASLILTIDREIQRSMEEVIDKAIADNGAVSGTILVYDPRTGAVLAMAMTPRMDLNQPGRIKEAFPEGIPFNRAVSLSYEPGSVFKILTMAAALDTGTVKPETEFVDTGSFEIGGAVIHNWNGGHWGPQDMTGCMRHSLNVCLSWVAWQTGAKNFYAYMKEFGIGQITGIELDQEVSGRLKVPGDEDWYEAELGTNAFGQGVSVTPLQMTASIASVANGGKMMAPHIVQSIVNRGYQRDTEVRMINMPIKEETARSLNEMLAQSLEEEGSEALVTGYRVAGKTGTAEIPTPLGYSSEATNTSFVGWGPVDDPRFLVYVWLEKPATSPWGSVVAAPVFREAVQRLVVLLNLPPDNIRRQTQ